MIRTKGLEIKWHVIGETCKRLGFAFGAAFLALALLNRIPEYRLVAQNSPWIPKYIVSYQLNPGTKSKDFRPEPVHMQAQG